MRRERLIAARRKSGKSQEEIAEDVEVDRTTIGNWEQGRRTPRPAQRKPYADSLGVTLDELDAMLSNLPSDARTPVWAAPFLGMEQSATEILAHEPHVVHGLLQTPAYAAAIARSVGVGPSSAEYEERNMEQRRIRQLRVDRGDMALHVVQPEIAIRLRLGDGKVMAAQMDKIIELAKQDNVTYQVVPFTVGQYEALRMGSLSVMTHLWAPGRTVYFVRYPGIVQVEDPDEAANFIAAAEQATTLALPPDESLQFVAAAADEWRRNA